MKRVKKQEKFYQKNLNFGENPEIVVKWWKQFVRNLKN